LTHLVHPADAQRLVCPRCGRTFCSQCGALRAGRRICSTCAGDDTPRQNRKQMEWAVASLIQLIGLGGIFLWLAIQSLEPTSTSSVVTLDPATGKEIAAVYVPTTPNPSSGYVELLPTTDLVPLDWTVNEALTFIISGGAVAPEGFAWSGPVSNSPTIAR